jgi:hypothetical protein
MYMTRSIMPIFGEVFSGPSNFVDRMRLLLESLETPEGYHIGTSIASGPDLRTFPLPPSSPILFNIQQAVDLSKSRFRISLPIAPFPRGLIGGAFSPDAFLRLNPILKLSALFSRAV